MIQLRTSTAVMACLITLSVTGCSKQVPSAPAPSFNTEYQAVFMQSGQVFFGKLENLGSDYPVLRSVYYIQNQANQETKQVNSVLLKRSAELHGPDMMVLNARQVALIEPVAPDSRVGQLIRQATGQDGAAKP